MRTLRRRFRRPGLIHLTENLVGSNLIQHRSTVTKLIELAETLGAERVELANVQFYGWAFRNRASIAAHARASGSRTEVATAAKTRLAGKIDIFYVLPDYYETRPKPCLNGWAKRYLTVNSNW